MPPLSESLTAARAVFARVNQRVGRARFRGWGQGLTLGNGALRPSTATWPDLLELTRVGSVLSGFESTGLFWQFVHLLSDKNISRYADMQISISYDSKKANPTRGSLVEGA